MTKQRTIEIERICNLVNTGFQLEETKTLEKRSRLRQIATLENLDCKTRCTVSRILNI